ncbi:MAG: hypothetical protein IID44_04525 [Planctomycetes bacterium]|nr:hypothetical protein [Planctomycetota bacterium]
MTSNNTVAAVANGTTLTFNTTTLNVDPVDYVGEYGMSAVSVGTNFGTKSFVVIPGLTSYLIQPRGGFFRYNVDANGDVTSPNSDSLFGVGNTLFFKNTTINIDPGDFGGHYGNAFGGTVDPVGFRSIVVLPGIQHGDIQFPNGGGFVFFSVDADGNVTSKTPLSADGVGDTLFFRNSTLRIDPNDYTGTYQFHFIPNVNGDFGSFNGVQDFIVVPSQAYRLVADVTQHFDVAADCQPTPSTIPFSKNGVSFTLSLSCITNQPPTIAAQSFDVDENQTSVGIVVASDPDLPGDTLDFTLTGAGPDDALFEILPSGQLSFVAAPDFESPADVGGTAGDNIYLVEVKVTDEAGESAVNTISVTVLNQASISGVVFVDVDQDGLFDANEPGIDGVAVELLDASGSLVLETVFTSDGGYYLFEDLDSATYQLHELQPSGVDDGAEGLGSLGGVIVANDTMQLTLDRTDASDYVFAELGGQVTSGDTASIGFWQNKHGQALIDAGGASLATWLSTNFANVFGNVFDGTSVANFYKQELFKQKAQKSAGPAKVDAQFMATAMATYFTSSNLAGYVAADYGFNVTDTGIGTKIVNVGTSGAAFSVANDSNLTIMQLLLATNALTDDPDDILGAAKIYDTNGDGVIDATEAALRIMANDIYTAINEG